MIFIREHLFDIFLKFIRRRIHDRIQFKVDTIKLIQVSMLLKINNEQKIFKCKQAWIYHEVINDNLFRFDNIQFQQSKIEFNCL